MAITKFELIATLCLVSSIVIVSSIDTFSVQGRVYCDTCRVGFETNITEYVSGAKVKIECTHFTTNNVEHYNEAVTDSTGSYKIYVVDDHQDEICEVVLVDSSLENCKEIEIGRDRAQVLLANDGGISGKERHANSLGFLRNEPLPYCAKLLKEHYGRLLAMEKAFSESGFSKCLRQGSFQNNGIQSKMLMSHHRQAID